MSLFFNVHTDFFLLKIGYFHVHTIKKFRNSSLSLNLWFAFYQSFFIFTQIFIMDLNLNSKSCFIKKKVQYRPRYLYYSVHTVNSSLYDGCPFGFGTNGKA